MTHLSDQDLITLYLTTQNNLCFAQLYSRHRHRVYQRCLSICRDADEADDFTQEIFLRLVCKLASFKGQSTFTVWLNSVTTNYCIDQMRKQQQAQLLFQPSTDWDHITEPTHEDTDERSMKLMKQVIQQLPPRQRDLLLSKYEERVTTKTIARQQQVTPSAVKMQIKRARDKARYLYAIAQQDL